ncbi:G-patch domain and KOW motifs-containing protein-like [Liolophura sinensis]|uniref:G-patch domain and KOW motifs-containing protein-like n=1 Tax=Liolophura sinensis TaxID=3198878 RepID=UPI00315939CC
MEERDKDSPYENKPSLSFGFSKKLNTRKLQSSSLNEEKLTASDEQDFLKSVEGKKLQSIKPKEEEKELVIPCLVKNSWRKPVENKYKKTTDKPKEYTGALESQAVTELLEEARKQQEDWEDVGKVDSGIAIPVVVQNKLPEGYETDEKLDVSLRPDEAEAADYEQVPIEQYGLAMLRGMGWKPGEGVGRNKKSFQIVESVLRPKGLGLGADKSQVLQLSYTKQGQAPQDKKSSEELVLKKGAYCMIQKGAHKDLYGTVEGLDDDNARVMIKLTIGGKIATQSQYSIKLVTKQEYEKYSKYLNKGKVDKYKDEEDKKNRKAEEEERDRHKREERKRDRESDKRKDKNRHRDRSPYMSDDEEEDRCHRKHKKRSHYEHRSSPKTTSSSSSNGNDSSKLWVRPQIKVRVIDRHFKKGRYYNSKVVVVDVFDKKKCVVKTDDGNVLEGVSQSMIETVVPKSDPAYAMIVSGKHKGEIVQVMQRNKKSCIAMVQLLRNRDHALEIGYDSICEYAGNIDDVFDY